MSDSSVWSVYRTLSGTTIHDQSEPQSNGNEGVLHITQSSMSVASPSEGLISYSGHSLIQRFYGPSQVDSEWVKGFRQTEESII